MTAEPKNLMRNLGPLFLIEEAAKLETEELQEAGNIDNSNSETQIDENELILCHYENAIPIHVNLTEKIVGSF